VAAKVSCCRLDTRAKIKYQLISLLYTHTKENQGYKENRTKVTGIVTHQLITSTKQ